MARNVSVVLHSNVTPYVAGMGKASAATAAFSRTTQAQTAAASKKLTALGDAAGVIPRQFGALSVAGGAMFAAVGVAAGAAVKKFAEFDVAMDAVAASTMASDSELKQLGETAKTAAAGTKFGATEAARGIEALAKAGVSTTNIIGGGLKGALDLAAAGEIEVADAAEVAAGAMTQFNLAGEDVPHVADLMAAAAGKAQGDVTDMAFAFKQSGLVASQMGLSIEETTGTLAAFASNALTGQDAGTSFKTMLLRLANPSGEAAELMEKLGIAAYNAQGNFVGVESLAGQLSTRLAGLTQEQRDAAFAVIFGSDAIRAANVLYQQGSEGIKAWTTEVDDAGYAAQQAAMRTDNLAGDLERLGGALDEALISRGESGEGPLRSLVQQMTRNVNEINRLWTESVEIIDREVGPAYDALRENNEFLFGTYDTGAEKLRLLTAEQERWTGAARYAEFATFTQEERQRSLAAQTDRLTGLAAEYARQTNDGADATAGLTEDMAELHEQQLKAAEGYLGLRQNNRDWIESVDAAKVALEENGATLNTNTHRGRENEAALDAMAASALELLEDMRASGQGTDTAHRQMRRTLIETGIRFGMTETQAAAYADQVLVIPKTANTKANFDTATAVTRANALKTILDKIDGTQVNASLRLIETLEHRPRGGPGSALSSSGKLFPLPGGRSAYRVTQGPHPVNAIDYGAPSGTPVYASFSGFLSTRDLGNRSYGKHYRLTSGNNWVLGAHLSGFARSTGFISRGSLIGWTGSTGNSTGPHLHLENFHTGGWVRGDGPINAHGGEFVVNAAASSRNRGTLEAINAGGGGGVTLVNAGVIGSQIELQNWLARGVDSLRRQGRLS